MKEMKKQSEIEELIAQLEGTGKPVLSTQQKMALKQRLMSRVAIQQHQRVDHSIYSLVGAIRLLAEKVKLGTTQKVLMKENLLEMAEQRAQRKFFFSNYFVLARRMVSGVLVVVLAFGVFSYMQFESLVVNAGTLTALDSFSGEVKIGRDGELIVAERGMLLMEQDEVITGADGSAVIRYFDDSVSRLANNTRVVINRLVKPADFSVDTYVEVALIDGIVWSRVLNLVESDAAFVVKAMDVSAEAKKAAFNVEVDDGKVQIGVFNHAVSIDSRGETERVLTGEKLIVDNGGKGITQLNNREKDTTWVKQNMKNDQLYLTKVEQNLLEAKRKAVGLDSNGEISYETSLKEDALLFMTFDDVKKRKLALELAERNFVVAQVKLSDPNVTEEEKIAAQNVMEEFGNSIKDFYRIIDEIEHTDKDFASELKGYVDAKVMFQKRDLSVSMPDSPNYNAKKILDDAELVGAESDTERVKLKVDQAADKLAVAEDAKDSGNPELASKVVDEYKQDMQGVVEMIGDLPQTEGVVNEEVAEKVSNNIDLLKAIDVASDRKVAEVQKIVAPLIAKEEMSLSEGALVNQGTNVKQDVQQDSTIVDASTIVDSTETGEVLVEDSNEVVEGPYGVKMQGDKPLPPLLQNVE